METLYQLISPYQPAGDQLKAIPALLDGLNKGYRYQTLLGVTGSGKTYTMAQVIAQSGRPALILAPNKTLAAQLFHEMKMFFPNHAVEYFISYYDYYQPEAYLPASDTYIEKSSLINTKVEQMRLSSTKSLLERRDVIIVATVSAIYGIGDPSEYHTMAIRLQVNSDVYNRDSLIEHLVTIQYTRNEQSFERTHFRVRGEYIDIFPAELSEEAVRIIFDDNCIEQIIVFDPLTGEQKKKLNSFHLYPASHYVTRRNILLRAVDRIKEELIERCQVLDKNQQFIASNRLQQKVQFDLEMLLEIGFCKGIENYSLAFSDRYPEGGMPCTLMNYFPPNTLLIIDESHVTIPQLRAMYRADRSRKETLIAFGFRLPSALENRPLTFEEFSSYPYQTIFVSATPGEYEHTVQEQRVEQLIRPTGLLDPDILVVSADFQVDHIVSKVEEYRLRKEKIIVTVLTKSMAEKLTTHFHTHQIAAAYLHADVPTLERVKIIRELREGVYDVLVGINLLREGLDIPEVSLVAIFDADVQGFLRSERSLIQMIGRAARHQNGQVIFYANKITTAMNSAIEETHRRRQIQSEYNKKNNIIPRSASRSMQDIFEDKDSIALLEKGIIEENLDKDEFEKMLAALDAEMKKYAKQLNFQKAKIIRDRISLLKENRDKKKKI